MANDESYLDPTNLENKLKKHQEFEAECNANEQRIQTIAQVSLFVHKNIFEADFLKDSPYPAGNSEKYN